MKDRYSPTKRKGMVRYSLSASLTGNSSSFKEKELLSILLHSIPNEELKALPNQVVSLFTVLCVPQNPKTL